MYRITGDTTWQEKGWKMFESIIAATQTEHGHSAITNVLVPGSDKDDAMESFWFAMFCLLVLMYALVRN